MFFHVFYRNYRWILIETKPNWWICVVGSSIQWSFTKTSIFDFCIVEEQISQKSILQLNKCSLGVQLCVRIVSFEFLLRHDFQNTILNKNQFNEFYQPKKVTENQSNNQFRSKPEKCIVSRLSHRFHAEWMKHSRPVLNKHKYIQMGAGYQINVCFPFVTAND